MEYLVFVISTGLLFCVKRLYSILSFCLGACTIAGAAVDTSHLIHFDLNTGFPANNVYSLIQDHNGYLWFATDNGVVKYNGYEFKLFNTGNGLPSNDDYQLYEDQIGRIWVHSFSYQFGYIKDDKYVNIKLQTHDRIMHAYYTTGNGGFLFFGYWENACYFLGIVKGSDVFTAIPIYNMDAKMQAVSSASLYISDIFISRNCKMYGVASDGWLYVYDLLKPFKKYRRVCKIDYSHFPESRSNSIHITSSNIIHFAEREDNKLHIITPGNCQYRIIPFDKEKEEYIYTVLDDRRCKLPEKNLTVITNYAVYQLDSVQHIISRKKFGQLIPAKGQIAFEFRDKNDNIWYTTNSDGAWCQFKNNFTLTLDSAYSGLSGSKCLGLTKNDEAIWLDKNRSKLNIISSTGKVRNIAFPAAAGIQSFEEIGDSSLLLALASGIYKLNERNQHIANLAENKRLIAYGYGSGSRQEVDSKYWQLLLGKNSAMLQTDADKILEISASRFAELTVYPDSIVVRNISDENYEHMLFDSFSRVVIAYNKKKMLIYDPVSKKNVTVNEEFLSGLGLKNILAVEADKFGNVFIADDDKLFIYNTVLNRGYFLNTKFSINGSYVHVQSGKLIVAGNFGIAVAKIQGALAIGKFFVIPNTHSYCYNRVFDFSADSRGIMLLNTDRGIVRIDINKAIAQSSSLNIDAPDFFALAFNYPVNKKIYNNDTVNMDQRLEKINLDVINFYGSGKPAFEYTIAGSEQGRQQTNGEIFVGALGVGKYYQITCLARDEMWKATPVTFYVYRIPFWWQTVKWRTFFWVAGISFIAMVVLLIVAATRAVVARSNEKKRALLELELRAVYAQINPHFIFNTFSAAQYFISKKRFDDAYTHINKFSRLLRAYLKSSQDRYITLDEEVTMLRNYIELQQIRFEDKFEYRIEIDNKIPAMNLLIPSLLIQPLVENAINHGLFHKQGDGLLVIKFLQGDKDHQLICIIEDNGVGRHRARELNTFDGTRKESYGTKLTQQLINIYKEYEHVDISLEYIDKSGVETGTTVKLVISKTKFIA
jgi:hypothetical protein